MSKKVTWILYTVSSFLAVNALLVLYNLVLHFHHKSGAKPPSVYYKVHSSDTPHCCKCNETITVMLNGSISTHHHHHWNTRLDYEHIAAANPSLDPEYRTETLTRLGTDLNFDIDFCPAGSTMAKNITNFIPLHFDCPTLFVVGARKAGTSSLYQYLTKHPDFEGTRLDQGPKVGETYYFSSHYKSQSWDSYINLFPSDGVMTGDASVGNLVGCLVPKRLFESCGKQAKVVMLLRDPVNRFVSNFMMRARLETAKIRNTTSITTFIKLHLDNFFHKALEKKLDVTRMPKQWMKLRCLFDPSINMVYEGLYYTHLLNWLCNFPAENILVINSEEFYKKTSTILAQVLQFLGLRELEAETLDWITTNVYNKGRYNVPSYQKITEMDRKKLRGVYKPFNKALFDLLDWHNVNWMKQ